MSNDEASRGRTAGASIGSLTMIVLVFSLATVVVLAILLGALFVAIGVMALLVPAALVAGFSKTWRGRVRAGWNRQVKRGNRAGGPDDPPLHNADTSATEQIKRVRDVEP
jgi:hypothetical protein